MMMADTATETRRSRLKAALRENLKRRKAQARGREEAVRDDAAPRDEGSGAAKQRGE
jgi:hypothetical protein